ncbi:hypothetical protein PVAP13_8KG367902, partial [Panicum virgatum]
YPSEYDEDALVPPAHPVPFCRCEPSNQLAVVKQSRYPKIAGRAFYVCKWNDLLNPCHSFFFQWIDGPDKFDPRIRLFPYYPSESDGWPTCDFNEYIYGPRSHWPTEEEVRDFESGKKPWPCTTTPSRRCKCGILATKGVVPSELGYGYYCGNSYGEYWEGRTCDWESFEGRYDLMLQLGRTKESWKSRDTLSRKMKIRKEYHVTLPLELLHWQIEMHLL